MSIILQRLLSAIIITAALTACSGIPAHQPHTTCADLPPPLSLPPPAPPVPPIEADPLAALMQDYDSLRQQPATELSQAYKKTYQDFLQTQSNSSRVESALLLALPDTPFHDTTAALNLLNSWPKDATDTSTALHDFAHLLSVLLTQQQRSNATVNDLNQKLKDEQIYTENLQKKIDAVKAMEKNLVNGNKQ